MNNISGQYKILEDLSFSGNSILYLAVELSTNKPVILKTANMETMSTHGMAKLRKEYAILSRLKSEFVPKVIDFAKIGEQFFLVLEYYSGVPLSEYIKTRKITVEAFFPLAQAIVKGLADIHRAGIIHKDISTPNIIYDPLSGQVTIVDFGISAAFSFETPLMTDTTAFEGSLFYISPEQTGRMNRAIDFRTDFYSLGITFFEMLCGARPFDSESPMELIYDHIAKIPPSIRTVHPQVPEMLAHMLAKLMEKMPEDRYQSAEGILFDLHRCLDLYDVSGDIGEFALGLDDYAGHINIPRKLYGRENEIALLEKAYHDISSGGKCAVFVGGHAGIGKTSLVCELNKYITRSNGILLSGKYDQYQKNLPRHAFFQLLGNFCDIVLSESEQGIAVWRERISAALGADINLLTDKVPRLALITGPPQPSPALPPIEAGARFKAAVQRLLAVIASLRRPFIIFLDDIHLVTSGAMDILEESMDNDDITGLMIVTCYRDNEVDGGDPVMLSINKLLSRKAAVYQFTLSGLDLDSVALMLSDTLYSDRESVEELAGIIYNKTHGNPFYIRQFLMVCEMKGHLCFSRPQRRWIWDAGAISACPAEQNVVDFLIRNMDQLPPEVIRLLSFGACGGRSFSLALLSVLSGMRPEKIAALLRRAVSIEVIYPLESDSGEQFQFAHDRFQQAFYTILPESERQTIHYTLAKYYDGPQSPIRGRIGAPFMIADHYAKAFGRIGPVEEKRRVARALLDAAREANLLSFYDMAIGYLRQLIESLDEVYPGGGEDAFSVYAAYHLALCSLARYAQADTIYSLMEELAPDPIDLTDNCSLQAVCLSNRVRYKDAFMLGVGLLEKLGVHFPERTLSETVCAEVEAFYGDLERVQFVGAAAETEAADKVEFAIAKLLNRITAAGFFCNPLYSFWTIIVNARRTLAYGYTPESLQLYANLSIVLLPLRNDYALAYTAAVRARDIAEKAGYKNELYRIYHVFSLFTCHWFEDVKNSAAYARESLKGNHAAGDFEFACYSYFTTQQAVLETCRNIGELAAETEAALAYANKMENRHAAESYISYAQLYKSLKGTTDAPGSFEDDAFSEQKHMEAIASDQTAQCYYYILRALSAVIYLDYDTAFALTQKALPLLPAITGFYPVALHCFLYALSICKRLEGRRCDEAEKKRLWGVLEANQIWLEQRAADAPANFLHLHSAIHAEITALRGGETVLLYEKAIHEAEISGKPYHYAIICELAAQRFQKLNAKKTAANFLREAYSAYLMWEADGKVAQIRRKNSGLLTAAHGCKKTALTAAYPDDTLTATTIDFAALIHASQAISGEMELEGILEKLIKISLEISGAQDIYYLIKNAQGGYMIRAEGHAEGRFGNMTREISPACIALSVLNYADRTGETVLLANAACSDLFGADAHIVQYGSKSILCMPVVNKGDLKGMLYLENRLIEGVFDNARIKSLTILSSQLAISLENAYLYSNLQFLVEDRTKELREEIEIRQAAEKRLEHMVNHDALTNLPNRRMFQSRLKYAVETASYKKEMTAVLFADLDGFKAINDVYGHEKGDAVLAVVARRLAGTVKNGDMVCRLGGDEFILVVERAGGQAAMEVLCRQLIDAVGQPIDIGLGIEAVVTLSIGVSILGKDGVTAEALIANSDRAMYTAKKRGKNRYAFYKEK